MARALGDSWHFRVILYCCFVVFVKRDFYPFRNSKVRAIISASLAAVWVSQATAVFGGCLCLGMWGNIL